MILVRSSLKYRQLATVMKIADRYNMVGCISHCLLRLLRQIKRTDNFVGVVDAFLKSLTKIDAPNIRDIFEEELVVPPFRTT